MHHFNIKYKNLIRKLLAQVILKFYVYDMSLTNINVI